MKKRTLLVSLPLMATTFACGNGLVDKDYPGEALITVSGVLQNPLEVAAPDDLGVYLYWVGTESAVDEAAVTGSFPSDFQLEVFQPPGDDAMLGDTDGNRALAMVLAISDEESSSAFTGSIDDDTVWGLANAVLFYVKDVDKDPQAAELKSLGMKNGFNLLVENAPGVECENAVNEREEACQESECTEFDPNDEEAYDACIEGCDLSDEHLACPSTTRLGGPDDSISIKLGTNATNYGE